MDVPSSRTGLPGDNTYRRRSSSHQWYHWRLRDLSLRDPSRVTEEEMGTAFEGPSLSICAVREGCLDQSQAEKTALSFTKCPCTSRWIF